MKKIILFLAIAVLAVAFFVFSFNSGQSKIVSVENGIKTDSKGQKFIVDPSKIKCKNSLFESGLSKKLRLIVLCDGW